MKNNKLKHRKQILKKRIISISIFSIIIGGLIYIPIKIKHINLVQAEVKEEEKFNLQMQAINDFKDSKENLNNIYTTEEKLNEIKGLTNDIEGRISYEVTEEVKDLIRKLKSIINEISASNQIELESIFNNINKDSLNGFDENEMNKVNEIIDKYNELFNNKEYKQAKETLDSLNNYISETQKVANERRIKEVYEEKSNEDASLREAKYVNGILIVNKEFGLPDDFSLGESIEARSAFEDMKADASKSGIYINAFSTYRSYWSQDRLYWNYVSNYGEEPTDTFSAKPGFSEHQTGLAFDIGGVDRSLWAEEDFKYTDEAKWLKENCYKYGFILRYPEGKEWKTGYMHESWHFRYIGTEYSKNFKNNDLTLEEYLGL